MAGYIQFLSTEKMLDIKEINRECQSGERKQKKKRKPKEELGMKLIDKQIYKSQKPKIMMLGIGKH